MNPDGSLVQQLFTDAPIGRPSLIAGRNRSRRRSEEEASVPYAILAVLLAQRCRQLPLSAAV